MSADEPTPSLPPVDPSTAGRVPSTSLSPELLASLLADGDDELAAWTLRHALAEDTREAVYDGLLADAMRLVGDRWASGQWSVAEEHLASQTLLRALDRIRPDLGPDGRVGPLAVLAGVAGEHHMIGLVCLDHVLRENGWTVANLGADVPTTDLASFVQRNEARLVALTVSDPARTGAAAAAIDAVQAAAAARGASERLPVMLGGRLAGHPGIASTLRVDWSGTSIGEAARFAASVVRSLSATER